MTVQLKPYPRYRSSDTPWVGEIPEHWELKPLFITMREIDDRNYGNEVQNVLSLSYGKIVDRDVESNFGLLPESFETYQIVEKGDVILRLTDLQNDQRSLRVGSVRRKGIITSAYVCLRGREHTIEPEYAFWLLATYDFKKVFYGLGSGVRQVMSFVDLKRMPMVLPKIDEQRTIAAFLDHTTAQLDDLIAQKRRLIELLKEKRQALITSAVTKGLNPKSKMKDSGVAWLGQIPEHWGVRALKRLVSIPITDGPHETPTLHDSGVPFVSAEAIQNGKIEFGSIRGYISPESDEAFSRKYSPKRGDIYMVKSGATTGRIAMVETDERFNIWSPLAAMRCNSDLVLPEFMLMALQSDYFQRQIQLFWNYGTQQNIGMGVIGNLKFILPPLEEQREAIKQVVGLNRNIVELEFQAEKSTHKLQEYRQSLISAAVTGRIDLRNWKTA